MVSVGLLVMLEAKPGKEVELEALLRAGLPLAKDESATTAWFAIRFDLLRYGMFDVFPDESGRKAHLSGQIAEALMAKAPQLLAKPPSIEQVDVLAAKLPLLLTDDLPVE
jgi:quinol monooxygenase YgiN